MRSRGKKIIMVQTAYLIKIKGVHMKTKEEYYTGVLENRRLAQDKSITACPCPNPLCDWHGKCKECVALHRYHADHIPFCLQPVIRSKVAALAGTVEMFLEKREPTPLAYRHYVKERDGVRLEGQSLQQATPGQNTAAPQGGTAPAAQNGSCAGCSVCSPGAQGGGAVLETPRLILRKLEESDYEDLCLILQDEETMYAYEHAFSHEEVKAWLGKQLLNYATQGYSLFAVIEKASGAFIGQCGPVPQTCEGEAVCEISYLFNKAYWHRGYAIEAAAACKEYAFEKLQIPEVCSMVRDTNLPSQNVAIRNGMVVRKRFIKEYMGITMPHFLFVAKK